jgi:hypothetical protein
MNFRPKIIFAKIANWCDTQKIRSIEDDLHLAHQGYRWDKLKSEEVKIDNQDEQRVLVRRLNDILRIAQKRQSRRAAKYGLY